MKKLGKLILLVFMTFITTMLGFGCADASGSTKKQVSISLNEASIKLDIGQEFTLIAEVEGTNEAVVWSAANLELVSITQDGVVTGLVGDVASFSLEDLRKNSFTDLREKSKR